MVRFRPDVVHIASPATLGYQAARAARVARHPDRRDLPDRPGRLRRALRHRRAARAAMAALTRRIHLGGRPHARARRRPASPSSRRLGSRGRPAGRAASTWTLFDPALPRRGPARRARARRRAPRRVRRPAGARRRSSSCSPTSTGSRACASCSSAAGPEEARLRALLPDAAFLGVLHGEELAPRPTPRSTSSCTPAATRPTASPPRRRWPAGCPVVAPRAGGPIDVVDDGVAGFLYAARRRAPSWWRTSSGWSTTRCCARGWRSPRAAACRAGRGRRSTSCWSSHYREVSGSASPAAAPAERRPSTTCTASSTVSTRWTCGSIARPRGQRLEQRPRRQLLGPVRAGRRSTIGATDDSSA